MPQATYSPSKTGKKIKQLETLLSSKQLNINDLKKVSWNGIPFGNKSF